MRQGSRLRTSGRTGRRARAAPRGRPSSATTPSSTTTARSAISIVDRRCAAIRTVSPSTAGRRPPTRHVLGVGVDGRERIVEHEHAPARDQGAGERHSLALAAGEVHAALADQRVVSVRKVVDERGDARRLRRCEDLVPVRVGPAAEQVLPQRDREQDRPLGHDRDGLAQVGEREVARVDAADEHAPCRRVVEPRKQVEQRRLARARSAADGHDLARLDLEVDSAQGLALFSVGEANRLEPDSDAAGRKALGLARLRAASRCPPATRSCGPPRRGRAARG